MISFIDTVVGFYCNTRQLLQELGAGGMQSRSSGARHTAKATDVAGVSRAVASGAVSLGDRVTGQGWFSTYAYWYLPTAYAPYRFETAYLSYEGRTAMKMTIAPALLPAGQIPFEHDGRMLGFLYQPDASGFDLELAEPADAEIPEPRILMASPDDQPWLYNLDTNVANFSSNPLHWTYTFGDGALASAVEYKGTPGVEILTDPRRVRQVVQVPDRCKAIPVLFPRGHCDSNQPVTFTARVVELDKAVLDELSRLGAPLSERVYSLFYQFGGRIPPFCLEVEGDTTHLRPSSAPPPVNADQQLVWRPMAFVVEFFFENSTRGTVIPFDDAAVVEWFLPAVKNYVLSYPTPGVSDQGIRFPDRWMGKVYGFDGPIYLYKTGPIEVAISPTGVITVQARADTEMEHQVKLGLWKTFVLGFQGRVLRWFKKQRREQLVTRTTYMTDANWQPTLGRLLDGAAFERASKESYRFQVLRAEVQAAVTQQGAIRDPVRIDDIDEFALARQVPRSAITETVREGVRKLSETEEVEPFLRDILADHNHTPHTSTEIADILTTHLTLSGRACLAAFVNKGKATSKVTSERVAHQIVRLRQVPNLGLMVLLAVGNIQDDARRDLARVASDGNADYLIVDTDDVARLFIAYDKICPTHGVALVGGTCPTCGAPRSTI